MPPPTAPVSSIVLSVSSLNRQVRDCLESAFPLTWVGGEISNLTYAASGHVYFSLKDSSAQVRCVMWRSRAQLLGWRLENGQQIEARTLVSFYEPRGEFQLNVEAIRRAGQGDLFERFQQLKEKLEKDGIFAVDRKRQLPAFPLTWVGGEISNLTYAASGHVYFSLKDNTAQVRCVMWRSRAQVLGCAT